MTTAERNKQLREMADLVAAEVAKVLGKQRAPKCQRITRRRGYGYPGGSFSVPEWASRVTDYFIYYAAHEAIHCLLMESGHGPNFKKAEGEALAHFGLSPVYGDGGTGPYVENLFCARTGRLICTKKKNGAYPVSA